MADDVRGGNIYEQGLDKTTANYRPLTPLSYLDWAARVFPEKTAIIHGPHKTTWAEFDARCKRLASALQKRGIGPGDTVSVMSPNAPAMLEAHYGVPMSGGVLNALNFRLDAETIAFILKHAETKVLITDREFADVMRDAVAILDNPDLLIVDVDDPLAKGGHMIGGLTYEELLAEGDPGHDWQPPEDEWQAICLNYTSGTTGNPKGVVYHHRGAYLNSMSNALVFRLGPESVYLWTLPMFHCNGWTYTWAGTAVGGTHVCLRNVDPALIFPLIEEHRVTHMCGAPIVLNMLVHAPADVKRTFEHTIEVATGGAAPPSTVISRMEGMGFNVTHMYGLTETYGPSTICVFQDEWAGLPLDEKAAMMARQGVRTPGQIHQTVRDPDTMDLVPEDGETIGEIMFQSNTVMRGYLKNPTSTEDAFRGGWYHTGDLAVQHPDGYIEVKDRSKDIIISGGENISSLEVEECLYKHPGVMECAVVAMPSEKWGETPVAFVTPTAEAEEKLDARELIDFCKERMARFKAPTRVVFGPLPKTSTGKIQKFVLRERVDDIAEEKDD